MKHSKNPSAFLLTIPLVLSLFAAAWIHRPVFVALPPLISSATPTIEVAVQPTMEPTRGLALSPGDRVRVLTVEQWRALLAFPESDEWVGARSGWCEGQFNPAIRIIDVDGLPRVGAWSVGEMWWGPVPGTLEGQAQQVAGIIAEVGWAPFTGAAGCEEWNR